MIEPATAVSAVELLQRLHAAIERTGKAVHLHGTKWWVYGTSELCFRTLDGVFHVGRHYVDVHPTPDNFERETRVFLDPRQEPFGRYEIRDQKDVNALVLEALRMSQALDNCINPVGTRTHDRRGQMIYALRYPDHQEPKP